MLQINNVSIKRNHKIILKKINLNFKQGEKIFVIGSSGAGKTTFINAILEPSTIVSGNILIASENLSKISKKNLKKKNSQYGILMQDDFFINWETVYFNIKNYYPHYKNSFLKFFNIVFKKDKESIFKIAKKLKINNILFKKMSDISGGERQRVKLLLLLLRKPRIILADEPTNSLDIKKSKYIINWLYQIKDTLVIINMHKLELIPQGAKRVIAIKNKKIIFDGTKQTLTAKKIKEIYD